MPQNSARTGPGWAILLGRALFHSGLLIIVLPKGGVHAFAFYPACILIGLAAILGRVGGTAPSGRSPQTAALILAASFAAYLAFQAASFPGNPFANEIWAKANALLGYAGESISVQPSATYEGMFTALLPILIYVAAVDLFQRDDGAFRLIRFLGILGGGFALFGVIQIVWLRDSLLFFEKIHYRDSLTSVFVNRNTAGTLLGVASFVLLILTVCEVRNIGGHSPLVRLFSDPSLQHEDKLRVAVPVFFFLLTLLALFLTKSRGALLATLLAYLVIAPALVRDWMSRRRDPRQPAMSARRRIGITGAVVVAIGLIAIVFGSQAFTRLEQQGADIARLCVYGATWRAFLDNWLFGVGFGTFENAFPRYRPIECGIPYGIFVRAHNFYLEGLFGLGIVFVPFLIAAYWHIARNIRTGLKTRRSLRYVPIAAAGMVILVTLHSLVDFSLQIPGMAAYFAATLGATTTICLGRSAMPRSSSDKPLRLRGAASPQNARDRETA
ncbi:O-antigen ligase family protein [Jiella sp. CBK1P-4]|uniref:O-antigen ligase family protein n=1 Tax=Jiella avicenniae TaxID=2907202 RepID=A0A9X1T7G0_9HYPH|nr:O-antigen ligase family protein [Jiella avicenniae]